MARNDFSTPMTPSSMRPAICDTTTSFSSDGVQYRAFLDWKKSLLRTPLTFEGVETYDDCQEARPRTAKMARLEAALFVAEGPMSLRKLAQAALLADFKECRQQIEALNDSYDASRTPFRIEQVAGDFQLLTRPNFAFWLNRLHQRKTELKLSRSMLETLSIIAYRQPLTRADVESVRGVQSSELIKQLMERGLVKIDGFEDTLGRPYLYRTTKKFLELFGLQNLAEMPMYESLVAQTEEPSDETVEDDVADETDNEIGDDSEAMEGDATGDADELEAEEEWDDEEPHDDEWDEDVEFDEEDQAAA